MPSKIFDEWNKLTLSSDFGSRGEKYDLRKVNQVWMLRLTRNKEIKEFNIQYSGKQELVALRADFIAHAPLTPRPQHTSSGMAFSLKNKIKSEHKIE